MVESWIKHKGRLGGKGFLTKKTSEQKKLIKNCVKKYGYKSCLGAVNVLSRNRKIEKKYSKKLKQLSNIVKRYKLGP